MLGAIVKVANGLIEAGGSVVGLRHGEKIAMTATLDVAV